MNPPPLHSVEITDEPDAPLDSGSGGGGRTRLEARVAALETHMHYLATKEDIQKIKVWVLCGLLGGISLAVMLVLASIRWLFMPSA